MTPSDPSSFPRLQARTRRFLLGEPRAIELVDCRDGGTRLFFLRSLAGDDARTGLWAMDIASDETVGAERLLIDPAAGPESVNAAERARRERAREVAVGVVAYSVDRDGRTAAALHDGKLTVADAETGTTRSFAVPADAFDARISPNGRLVAFCSDRGLFVLNITTAAVERVAGDPADPAAVYWARAEHVAAEELNRFRGYWWAPDSASLLVTRVDESAVGTWWITDPADPATPPEAIRYARAGTANADVSLWWCVVDPTARTNDGAVQVRLDPANFEYLVAVAWPPGGAPVIAVQNRAQTIVLWLEVGSDGSTRPIAEDVGRPWVELHPGAPEFLGSQLVRIADRDGSRRLIIGEETVGPALLHIRGICGVSDGSVVVTANAEDSTSLGVWAVAPDGFATPIATAPGVHTAVAGGRIIAVSSASLEHSGTRTWLYRAGREIGGIASRALPMPYAPSVDIFQTPSGVRVGVVFPRDHVQGRPLPVLMAPYAGPHVQSVLRARRLWLGPQWWADQGFAVVVVDGRGTPGLSIEWEHAVHGDLATPVLADQAEGLRAAADRCREVGHDLDLARVAILGWSFGGFLAALAVLRRPDAFHAAIAGAPVTDQRLYDTHYTERYLGTDTTGTPYAVSSVIDDAATLTRPLMIVHGLADDNVVVAHSLRFSAALTAAGRPHTVLPLPGITHLAIREDVAENLLLLQRDFLRDALGLAGTVPAAAVRPAGP